MSSALERRLERILWEANYDDLGNCKHCGSFFYSPCKPNCKAVEPDCLNTVVICGDCLRPDCKGCKF